MIGVISIFINMCYDTFYLQDQGPIISLALQTSLEFPYYFDSAVRIRNEIFDDIHFDISFSVFFKTYLNKTKF